MGQKADQTAGACQIVRPKKTKGNKKKNIRVGKGKQPGCSFVTAGKLGKLSKDKLAHSARTGTCGVAFIRIDVDGKR